MPTKVSVQPAEEPVSRSEAKAWLKVDNTADDDLIDSLIVAARMAVEDFTNLKLISQTIEEVYSCFPWVGYYRLGSHPTKYDAFKLTCSPLIAVTSIEYKATAVGYTTLDSSNYTAHTYQKPPIITPAYSLSWPEAIDFPEAVKITYTAGLSANAAGVPALFKNAILKILTSWYEKRGENVKKLPTDVEYMLNIQRIIYW